MRFRLKITLCFTALLAVAFAVGGILLVESTVSELLNQEEDALLSRYQMILSTADVLALGQETAEPALVTTLTNMAPGNGWDAARLMDRDGTIKFLGGTGPNFRTDIMESATRDTCALGRFQEDGNYMQLSGLVEKDGALLHLDLLVRLDDRVFRERDALIQSYERIFAVLLPVSALVCYLLSLVLTLPLSRLRNAVRSLAEGDLKARAPVRSHDEVGTLSRDFNAMAEHLEQNFEQLQSSMERQQLFMGSFAHELKTPMTSIIGYADLIRGQNLSAAEQQESANYIFTEGKRLESLSLKLLDLLVVQRRDFTFQEVSVSGLLERTVLLIRPSLAGAGMRLRYHFGAGTCLLEPDLVQSLVMNLIDNARKAMESGGEIRLRSAMTKDGCIIEVQDTGKGMEPEELERITEAFYRVDKARSRALGGAGLGLSLCREIVSLHHGRMEFRSKPGAGTVVTVTLKGGRR